MISFDIQELFLSPSLGIKDEDAPEDLLSLSPYEMRNLLHHLMNGEEFLVERREKMGYCIVSEQNTVSKVSQPINKMRGN